jgi:hypothetical protein
MIGVSGLGLKEPLHFSKPRAAFHPLPPFACVDGMAAHAPQEPFAAAPGNDRVEPGRGQSNAIS